MTQNQSLQDISHESNWYIKANPDYPSTPSKIIGNRLFKIPTTDSVYNYSIYTPIILAPVNKTSTFILSACEDEDGDLSLWIHDLRMVNEEVVGSIAFQLRGNQIQLGKLKNELSRQSDDNRCVGVSFLFRKIYYANFRVIYADKVLRPKIDGSLQTAFNIVDSTMQNKEIAHDQ